MIGWGERKYGKLYVGEQQMEKQLGYAERRPFAEGNTYCLKMNSEESWENVAEIGVQQGYIVSSLLFDIVVDEAVKEAKKKIRNQT